MNAVLTARLGRRVLTVRADCEDSMDATAWGIAQVLNRASQSTMSSKVWAKGAITITYNGEVIHTMEAKEQA